MKKALLYLILPVIAFISSATVPDSDADLTLNENLNVPVVPDRSGKAVQAYMRKEAESLVKLGYRVETMRKGEIVIVTVPTDPLFPPNDSILDVTAANKLIRPLAAYMRNPQRYKVLIAVHTDDTGSEKYTEHLSGSRVASLYSYFDRIAGKTANIIGYPLGQTQPEVPNSSRAGREKNRRIEFYIIPETELIKTIAKRSR